MGSLRDVIVALACTFAIATAVLHPLSDEFIDLINSKQSSWKAGRNFHPNTSMKVIKNLVGVSPSFNVDSLPSIEHDAELLAALPESFDPRKKWPNCSSLNEIRDQGACGSCWVFGAVTAMTDRICIFSNGDTQFHVSAEDLVSCCHNCGNCQGGNPKMAWNYWKKHGLVSGGNYNSGQDCRPYSIASCEQHVPWYEGNSTNGREPCIDYEDVKTPKCTKKCSNSYGVSYKEDKQYGRRVYSVKGGEEYIMAELLKHGPVEAAFLVFTDFFHYKSGVYQYVQGDFVYGHAVKLMGWGVENGIKYWLIANSWNSDWGDNGFFKILRGENHLGVESNIVTGEPLLRKL